LRSSLQVWHHLQHLLTTQAGINMKQHLSLVQLSAVCLI